MRPPVLNIKSFQFNRLTSLHVALLGLFFLLSSNCTFASDTSPTPAPRTPTSQALTTATPDIATPTPTLPPDSIQFITVATGKYHACGLQEDGTAVCWGRNDKKQLQTPEGVKFQQITAGLDFSCGITDLGTIKCWGSESHNDPQIPDGTFTAIDAGRSHICALDEKGIAICWRGETQPPNNISFTEIGAGHGHICGLTRNGDLQCWGSNHAGQSEPRNGPFNALAVGLHNTCVLREDNSTFCQGENYAGQSNPPDTIFKKIATGWEHGCGITQSGNLQCWGAGQASNKNTRMSAPDGDFTQLSIGWRYNCGIRTSRYVECWTQPNPDPSVSSSLNLTEALSGQTFVQPVELFSMPDGSLAVVERTGSITAYSPGEDARTILDLTDKTECCRGEIGMLSAALDPEFDGYPFIYIYYHVKNIAEEGVLARLARFTVTDGYADIQSQLVLLDVPQPSQWHNGGAIRFGPDGMLYLGFGDSGEGNKVQDLTTLRGKIIRINIRNASKEKPYYIPEDNPMIGIPNARHEIWAYGMRNPWRMNFDSQGRLFLGDVGGSDQEEISIANAGANLGSPIFEGKMCMAPESTCAKLEDKAVAPLATLARDEACAIIGGIHYQNDAYLFGDLCSGQVWKLEQDTESAWQMTKLAKVNRPILSFATDANSNIYILTDNGPILRLESNE